MNELSPERILKEKFGYDSFRPLQKEIISNVLLGKDCLAIMPTGGGKSLCYQIPALLLPGITLVVSPLIALMQDQVAQLTAVGIEAQFLNSTLDWKEYNDVIRNLVSGKTKILYLSPEGLATERVRRIFSENNIKISCITIDESHCISQWGHDFRPDYLEISSFRAQFPDAVCLALTATATEQVRKDIISYLKLKEPSVLIADFNRKNIYLQVRPKKDADLQVINFLNEHKEESGIIYCFSRKQVDELYTELLSRGFSVLNYHAGLSDSERASHQEDFIRDKVDIMVATIAFGMGINKPNVRFVIHYDLPKSLEQYYQEIGRAGRDGNPATALLLYSAADIRKIRYFFDEAADSDKAEILLQGMIKYATARSCRRQILLRYFGQDYIVQNSAENCCDCCSLGPLPQKDLTIPAQKFMSCMYRVKQAFGTAYIIDILLGSKQKRIIENKHNSLSTYGIGTEFTKEQWFELAAALEEQGFIAKKGQYNVLVMTELGQNALFSRAKIELPVRLSSISHSQTTIRAEQTLDSAGQKLLSNIKFWRKLTAEELNVPPYVIFGDRTMNELAFKKPQNRSELINIYGIGEAKAERWGKEILKMIKDSLKD